MQDAFATLRNTYVMHFLQHLRAIRKVRELARITTTDTTAQHIKDPLRVPKAVCRQTAPASVSQL